MRLEFMFLAKAAEVHDGLISVIGGAWDTLRIPATGGDSGTQPMVMRGTLVARVLFTRDEAGTAHPLQIAVRSADGIELAGVLAVVSANVAPDLPQGWDVGVPIAIDLTGIVLPGTGFYEVAAQVDGALLGAARFRIVEDPALPGGIGGPLQG